MSISRYLQFVLLLIQKGRGFSVGPNFSAERREALMGLEHFLNAAQLNKLNTITPAPTRWQYWKGQAAFFKNSWKAYANHLQWRKLAYIRIPKAASTSACAMMLYEQQPELRHLALTDRQLNYLADVMLDNSIRTQVQYFTFVRNPFARLAAVYHEFFKGQPTDFIYGDYLFGILTPQLTFDAFVNRVALIPDLFKDQHLKPQHVLLQPYWKAKCNVKVLKLEDRPALDKFLQENQLSLPHRHEPRSPYDYRTYYSTESFRKVAAMYAQDISFFGYETEQKELEKYLSNSSKSVH